MPPRRQGRHRKGQRRADAAIDAMRNYGFPEKIIRETIKELLEVYGDNGWPLIEDYYYKVLLETILEKSEKEATEVGNCSQENNTDQNNDAPLVIAPSVEALATVGSQMEDTSITLENNEVIDAPLLATGTEHSPSPLTTSDQVIQCLPPAEDVEELTMSQDHRKQPVNNVNPHPVKQPDCNTNVPLQCIQAPDRVNAIPGQRRQPCYGWISNEDEEDIIELTPASPAELEKLLFGIQANKNQVGMEIK